MMTWPNEDKFKSQILSKNLGLSQKTQDIWSPCTHTVHAFTRIQTHSEAVKNICNLDHIAILISPILQYEDKHYLTICQKIIG
jgi:hypothetical protein